MRTRTGLDIFCEHPSRYHLGKRLGILANPASVDSRFVHARDRINEAFPGRVTALYAPQHGFYADKQDNMKASDDFVDPELGVPVFSLYGQTRIPTPEMMAPMDTLIIDLQDVGTRVYTFIYTMAYCMEEAGRHGKQVLVLDRPNPVGGNIVEGNLLIPEYASFVGRFPIPMRHGLTIGEVALLFNGHFGIGCDLTVVPMENWRRDMYFEQTGLPWVAPSPNLPTPVSALVYPGQVIWEGTNISEGRGTTRPFELFGAPFIDSKEMTAVIGPEGIAGAVLRPVMFEPTSNKWAGQPCRGFQIHPIEPDRFRPYSASLALLRAILKLYPGRFAWSREPYEYEYDKLAIDLILGNPEIRQRLERQETIDSLEASWGKDLGRFKAVSEKYFLYE
jgi:uncharacterized protein YbbC (DUF1343 family)